LQHRQPSFAAGDSCTGAHFARHHGRSLTATDYRTHLYVVGGSTDHRWQWRLAPQMIYTCTDRQCFHSSSRRFKKGRDWKK